MSSPQLDRADRGFSYRHDAPLDMRMDRAGGRTAADVVNDTDERDLARLLRTFGDERFATRIAKAIVAARPVTTTAELAELVRDAIPAPARRTGGHPAKRTFQAIRIAVNEELDILPGAIDQALDALAPGGRCAVLAYHSGEDRIVKARFRHAATGGWTRPGPPPAARLTPAPPSASSRPAPGRPTPPSRRANPRAASARLRAVEKLDPTTPSRHEQAPRHAPRTPRRHAAAPAARPRARPRPPAPDPPARAAASGPSPAASPTARRTCASSSPASGPSAGSRRSAGVVLTALLFAVLAALAGAHTLHRPGPDPPRRRRRARSRTSRRATSSSARTSPQAESPERIVAAAEAQGMVTPDDLVYLQPPSRRRRRAADGRRRTTSSRVDADGSWSHREADAGGAHPMTPVGPAADPRPAVAARRPRAPPHRRGACRAQPVARAPAPASAAPAPPRTPRRARSRRAVRTLAPSSGAPAGPRVRLVGLAARAAPVRSAAVVVRLVQVQVVDERPVRRRSAPRSASQDIVLPGGPRRDLRPQRQRPRRQHPAAHGVGRPPPHRGPGGARPRLAGPPLSLDADGHQRR